MMNEISRRGFLVACGTGAVSTSGCLGLGFGGPPEEVTVDMTDDLKFEPRKVEVKVGGKVTWENAGDVEHTVTAYENGIPEDAEYFASGGFESESEARESLEEGLLDGDDSYEHTFEVPGTYEYFCIPHESSMRGTVEVKE